MKIENEFQSVIKASKANFFFVACSGGVDSMVLLTLAKKINTPIHVLHVNYNLRGEDSIQDANFLINHCEQNNIPISIHDVNLKEQLNRQNGNLQNEARKVRYDFFQSKLNEIENSKLLVAHHQDDQIETFWLQLYRGSGLKGIAGMAAATEHVVRPLLTISKQELIDYALSNGIIWREDKSNYSHDYQRNLWRNKYIPFLTTAIPSVNDSVLILQGVFWKNLIEISSKIIEVKIEINKHNYIYFSKLINLEITETIELFRSLSIPVNQVNAVLKLFYSQKGSKVKWNNSTGIYHEIIREEEGFSFILKESKMDIPKLKFESIKQLPEIFDKQSYYFDSKQIKGELQVRVWQKGDRIYPIGLKGSKLISDVITDAKIPNSERNKQLIICDEEKILACVGLCVDRRAIAKKSDSMIRVFLQKET